MLTDAIAVTQSITFANRPSNLVMNEADWDGRLCAVDEDIVVP